MFIPQYINEITYFHEENDKQALIGLRGDTGGKTNFEVFKVDQYKQVIKEIGEILQLKEPEIIPLGKYKKKHNNNNKKKTLRSFCKYKEPAKGN